MISAIKSYLYIWIALVGVFGGLGGASLLLALGLCGIIHGFVWQGALAIFIAPALVIGGMRLADWGFKGL